MEHTNDWKRLSCANIDESALLSPGKAIIRYKDREIRYISATHSDQKVVIEVQYRNGKRVSWNTTQVVVVHCMMWGIPLSFDCKYIFVPLRNGGVRCLSVEDGSIVWKSKSRAHFKQIMVNTTGSICCASGENHIVVLDGTTGAEKTSKRISTNNNFSVIGKERILIEATSTKWYILHSETLNIIEEISKKDLNSLNGREIWKRVYKEWGSVNIDSED